MTTQANPGYFAKWVPWQKFTFRILVIFLTFYLLDYLTFFITICFGINIDLEKALSFLNKPLYWLDFHVYHIGYDPTKNGNLPPDYRFGVVLYITVFILSVFAGIIWSYIDRQRTEYNRQYYWFRVFVRFGVAMIMLSYGIIKLNQVQMSYPSSHVLLSRIGDQNHFSILWNFVGSSPGYEIFTGICEMTGALLLLFRRSSVFGSLVMLTLLVNVVALNIFYNVSVKILSFLLLVCVLFLLVPFFYRLIGLFFYQQQVSFTEKYYTFKNQTKNRLLNAGKCIWIGAALVGGIFLQGRFHKDTRAQKDRMYEVTSFTTNNILQENVTDTLNWKRLELFRKVRDTGNYAIIYNSKDRQDWYYYKIDSVNKTFTFHDVSGDVINWFMFNYNLSGKDQLNLTGKWMGYDVAISMQPFPLDNMRLRKEKIQLVQDF
jgi:hypothetical protein